MTIELYKIKNSINSFLKVDIQNRSRQRNIAEARFLYYYFARKYTKKSMSTVAKEIGYDHSTAVHGVKVVSNLIHYDNEFKQKYQSVEKAILRDNKFSPKFDLMVVPKLVHPYRLRYAKKPLRKIFVKRGQTTKFSNEVHCR